MAPIRISAAFPPVPETPDHIVLAEELGYHTAWVYDTPASEFELSRIELAHREMQLCRLLDRKVREYSFGLP